MVTSQLTKRVADLHNRFIVKQGREVPSKFRRSLSSGEKKALEDLQSKWQSGSLGRLQGVSTPQGVIFEQVPGGGGGEVTGFVEGVPQFKPGFQGVSTREGVEVERVPVEREITIEQVVEREKRPVSEVRPIIKPVDKFGRVEKKGRDFVSETVVPGGSVLLASFDSKPGRLDEARARAEEKREKITKTKIKGDIDILSGIVKPIEFTARKSQVFFEKKLPQGKTRDILLTPSPISVRELTKFALFDPALATTPQAFARAVSTKGLIPKTSTRFSAIVKPKGKIFDVGVISETKVAGDPFITISSQQVKQFENKVIAGGGKGITAGKVGRKKIAESFDIIGASKEPGKAFVTRELRGKAGSIKLRGDIGKGVEARASVQAKARLIEKPGIDLFTGKVAKKIRTVPKFEARLNLGTGFKLKRILQEGRLTGTVTPVTKDISAFVGTTAKPVTRIDLSGVSKIIREPNVEGIIKTIKPVTKKGDGFIVSKGLVSKKLTKTGTKQLQIRAEQSAIEQATASIKSSVDMGTKSIETVSKVGFAKPIPAVSIFKEPKVKSINRVTEKPIITRTIFQDAQKFEQLIKQRDKTFLVSGFRQLPEVKEDQAFASALRVGVTPAVKQQSRLKQASKQKFRLSLRERLVQRDATSTIPKLAFLFPKIKLIKFPLIPIIPTLEGKKKKKKKKKGKAREDIAFTEGFTARTLGLPRRIISDLTKSEKALGIRGAPIIR